MKFRYQEPYFMKQLHRQRERDAKELYSVFKGDIGKWVSYRLKRAGIDKGSVVRDKGKSYKAGKGGKD